MRIYLGALRMPKRTCYRDRKFYKGVECTKSMRKAVAIVLLLVVFSGSIEFKQDTVIVVVSNSIDYSDELDELIKYLEQTFDVIYITAKKYDIAREKHELFLIIGGPDALEGIGEIVLDILPPEYKQDCSKENYDTCYLFVCRKIRRTFFILAGCDREHTKEAIKSNLKEKILNWMPKSPIEYVKDRGTKEIRTMDITDLDNNSVYDFIFAEDKMIYIYEYPDHFLTYNLNAEINSIMAYDLDSDGQEEIIATCDIFPQEGKTDCGHIYVFNIRENWEGLNLKWEESVQGTPKLLHCYQNNVAVYSYEEQGEEGKGWVTIFDHTGINIKSLGVGVKPLDVGGSISKFEIKDINRDGKEEVIVAGIYYTTIKHDTREGQSLRIYDLEGNLLCKYPVLDHINDFQCHDMDSDGMEEIILAGYNFVEAVKVERNIKEARQEWKIQLRPPTNHIRAFNRHSLIRIVNNKILVANSDRIYLIDYFKEEKVSEFKRELCDIQAKFLFLIDIDLDSDDCKETESDDCKEIVVGDGLTLEIYELLEFETYEPSESDCVTYSQNCKLKEDGAPKIEIINWI